jgi:hypothetical protein
MLQLFDPRKLLPAYALVTAAISVLTYVAIQHYFAFNWEVYKVVGLSSSVSSVLTLILFSTPLPIWAWYLARCISKNIYPDLTGTWEGTITTISDRTESLKVRARIQHDLLSLFIDFHGETFDSVTMSATPIAEKGQHNLHYIYLSESKIPGRDAYRGTAVLRVREVEVGGKKTLSLSGKYHTERKTIGTIELQRMGTDTSIDVSFGPPQPPPLNNAPVTE